MNRSQRLASWLVVLLGALVTMGTSQAPGPVQTLQRTITRELPAGESVHLTVRFAEPAMDFARTNGGGASMQIETSGGAFTVVPDGSSATPLPVPAAMEGAPRSAFPSLSCAATGPCEAGFTLVGPAAGSAAQIALTAMVSARTNVVFPAGSVITIEED